MKNLGENMVGENIHVPRMKTGYSFELRRGNGEDLSQLQIDPLL